MTITKTSSKISWQLLLSSFLIFILTSSVWCANSASKEEVDDALFLTKYIRSGNITEGRRLSAVRLPDADLANLTSYSGYFTVNETTGSSLFFWFFPAQTGQVVNVTLLLWLQGGPGVSLGVGLFVEHGPLRVIKGENGQQPKVVLRNETWNREFALLFIDSPVGAGFSFTTNESFYATTHQEVSRDLLEALKQFFTVFSEYRGNPFFITGQSYAGKFVASLGAAIHRLGTKEEVIKNHGINLQGLAIGSGLCDPVSQLNYGDFLSATGLIDRKQRDWYREKEKLIKKAIKEGNRAVFMEHLGKMWNAFVGHTGLHWQYNFLEQTTPKELESWRDFVTAEATRTALHLSSHPMNSFFPVRERLQEKDVMAGVKAEVEELLEAGYRALFYAGNLDIIVAVPLVEGFVHSLNWTGGGGRKFYDSERIIYRVNSNDSKVAGYVKEVGNLLYVVVRNAGHLVPYDQPKVALDMITRFVKGRSFKNE